MNWLHVMATLRLTKEPPMAHGIGAALASVLAYVLKRKISCRYRNRATISWLASQ